MGRLGSPGPGGWRLVTFNRCVLGVGLAEWRACATRGRYTRFKTSQALPGGILVHPGASGCIRARLAASGPAHVSVARVADMAAGCGHRR